MRRAASFGCPRGLRLVLVWALACAPAAAQAQVWLKDGSALGAGTSAPEGGLPVLFVHGHKPGVSTDPDPNYLINWQKPLGALPCFQDALELPQNQWLGIEPYYIDFTDQHRSLVEDARDIADAVERILARHDPAHVPGAAYPTTAVRVAIIAYSKGTISSRLYLKSLHEQQYDLPAPRGGFKPISELVAISPPNHGLDLADVYTAFSQSLRQLNNGYKQGCSSFTLSSGEEDFIEDLNGHPIEDSQSAPPGQHPSEAPGSRPNGTPPHSGTLYVAIFADGERDLVGGLEPSGDCQGRRLAANLAPDAVNVELAQIAPGLTDTGLADSEVHQRTVHAPEVICVALHTVVHHRAPVDDASDIGDFACALAGGIPIITPRTAVVQVLDVSGSMLGAACASCDPKLEVLRESVQIFMDLWTVMAGPGDLLGMQFFGTEVEAFDPSGSAMAPLTSARAEAVSLALADLDALPGNLTAMGGGLQRAIEALQDPIAAGAPQRHVIVFSDGMQNVNPMVVRRDDPPPPDVPHFEIDDVPGRPSSNVSPAPSLIRLDQLGGIEVHTIGVGATEPFMALLEEIAAETGGTHRLTLVPDDDLRPHYVAVLIEALRGNSPQLVDYRRGSLTREGAVEVFRLGRSARRIALELSWKRGRKLSFSVHKDGVDVTGAGRLIDRDFHRLYALDLPAELDGQVVESEGEWRLHIVGPSGEAYQAACLVDEPSLEYELGLARSSIQAGEPLKLELSLSVEGRPLQRPVQVGATIRRPGDSLANLLAREPSGGGAPGPEVEGAGAARTRLQRLLEREETRLLLAPTASRIELQSLGDGRYAGTFAETTVPGPYSISVDFEGEDPLLGSFRRRESTTALIRCGAADPERSELSLQEVSAADGPRQLELAIVPRDRFGNHLGPDQADRIRLAIDSRPVGSPFADERDGTYRISFEAPPGEDPRVSVSVLDTPLLDAPLSELEGSSRPPRWAPGLLIVLLILALVVGTAVVLRR